MSKYTPKHARPAALTQKPIVVYATTFAKAMANPNTPFQILFEGDDSRLVVMRTTVRRGDDPIDAIQVMEVEGLEVSQGFYVSVDSLAQLAEGQQQYRPRAGGDPWAENNRAELFGYLLELIKNEGGHQAFRHMVMAEKIRVSIKQGNLSTDITKLFTPNRTLRVGIDTGEHILVIESGYQLIGGFGKHDATDRFVFRLVDAPLGVPQNLFKVGTYVLAADLLKEQGKRPQTVMDFAKMIIDAVPEEKRELLQELVDKIGDSEASVISGNKSAPKQVAQATMIAETDLVIEPAPETESAGKELATVN